MEGEEYKFWLFVFGLFIVCLVTSPLITRFVNWSVDLIATPISKLFLKIGRRTDE